MRFVSEGMTDPFALKASRRRAPGITSRTSVLAGKLALARLRLRFRVFLGRFGGGRYQKRDQKSFYDPRQDQQLEGSGSPPPPASSMPFTNSWGDPDPPPLA